VYDGFRKVERRRYRMPDGTEQDFDIKLEGRVCCCLPVTDDGHVILVRQYRPGPGKILLELPGGGLGKDEDSMEGMRRELLEETGYIGDLEPTSVLYRSAYSTSVKHNFLALHCRKVADPVPDVGEFVEVVLIPLSDLHTHLLSGELTDTDTGWVGLEKLKENR